MNRNDGVNFPQPSSQFHMLSNTIPTENVQYSTPIIPDIDKTPTVSSTNSNEVKTKKHQPKYRATKRPPSERRFQCDRCESKCLNYLNQILLFIFFSILGRFFTQKDVKRHMVVHTGLRNFACPYCSHRFGRKDHLVRHTKKSHNQDTRTLRKNRTTSNEPKKLKKSNRTKKPEITSAAEQPNTFATASTSSTTSESSILNNNTNEYNSTLSTTSYENYNPILLSTSTFPKLSPVDNNTITSTSTFSAHQAACQNYPGDTSSCTYSNSCYNPTENAFHQFPTEANANHYSLQHSNYIPYDGSYKTSTGSMRYPPPPSLIPHVNSDAWHGNTPNSGIYFKTLTTSIVDGFNPSLEPNYNNMTANTFHPPLNNSNSSINNETTPQYQTFN